MKHFNLKCQIAIAVCGLFLLSACASTGPNKAHTGSHVQNARIMPATVHFDFNKALIRETDRVILDDIAIALKTSGKAVAILEGHADEVGRPLYNEILGENRARAVRVYLRDKGVDPRRMTLISKGAKEPAAVGSSPESHAKNRRVEIFITLVK